MISPWQVAEHWHSYRAFIRIYSKGRVLNRPGAAPLDFGRAACEALLDKKRALVAEEASRLPALIPAGLATSLCAVNPFSLASWELETARARATFQRMRHRFITCPLEPGEPSSVLPADFEFSNYLLECINLHFEHVMHLGAATWLKIAAVMVAIYEVSAFFGGAAEWMLIGAGCDAAAQPPRNRRAAAWPSHS